MFDLRFKRLQNQPLTRAAMLPALAVYLYNDELTAAEGNEAAMRLLIERKIVASERFLRAFLTERLPDAIAAARANDDTPVNVQPVRAGDVPDIAIVSADL